MRRQKLSNEISPRGRLRLSASLASIIRAACRRFFWAILGESSSSPNAAEDWVARSAGTIPGNTQEMKPKRDPGDFPGL